MRVGDICTRIVIHTRATQSARQAAETMRRRHVGALVVVEAKGEDLLPVGMITDRDIVLAVVAPGLDADRISVGEIMSRKVSCCNEDEYLFDAIEIMRQRGVRRLPVIDPQGALIGIVTVDDIYGALGRQMSELTRALIHGHAQEVAERV